MPLNGIPLKYKQAPLGEIYNWERDESEGKRETKAKRKCIRATNALESSASRTKSLRNRGGINKQDKQKDKSKRVGI